MIQFSVFGFQFSVEKPNSIGRLCNPLVANERELDMMPLDNVREIREFLIVMEDKQNIKKTHEKKDLLSL